MIEQGCFILSRAVHFGACLLLFGLPAFECLVAGSVLEPAAIAAAWRSKVRVFQAWLWPVAGLSGLAWFLLVAMNMSGGPPDLATLKVVWRQTEFGAVCQWRLAFWLVSIFIFIGSMALTARGVCRRFCIWSQLVFSGLLLGSLAWAGHGQETSRWHLAADMVHLLVAGFWPTGLLPLFLVMCWLRRPSADLSPDLLSGLVRRFSAFSLVGVALLSFTGFVNGWFLVGSVSNLFAQDYGRWLLVKVVLFIVAVALGAMNLLWWRPRLAGPEDSRAAAGIRRNVLFELILAAAVIIIVAVLGILPPATQ